MRQRPEQRPGDGGEQAGQEELLPGLQHRELEPPDRARGGRRHRLGVRGDKVLNMALIGQKSGDMFSLHVYHDFDQFVEMTCNVSKCFLLQVK